MTVTVTIPMTLPSVANLRLHWAHKARLAKSQRAATRLALKLTRPETQLRGYDITPLAVTLTRVAPRALDSDNLASAFKAVRDEIAAYFGIDDADPRIVWRYAQQRGKPARVVLAFDVVAATEAA